MDRTLVTRAQGGDVQAFEQLATEAIDRLYSAALIIVRDHAIAEDAAQETLVRAWRGLPRLRDPDRFDAWLHRILVNACLDMARATRMRAAPLQLWAARADDSAGFEQGVDERDRVGRALSRLAPRERAVLAMRFFLGLSIAEVAAAMAVPVGTAKSRLHSALAAMRAAIDADARTALQGGVA